MIHTVLDMIWMQTNSSSNSSIEYREVTDVILLYTTLGSTDVIWSVSRRSTCGSSEKTRIPHRSHNSNTIHSNYTKKKTEVTLKEYIV